MKFVELPEKVRENLVVVAPTGSGKTTAILKNLDSYKLQFNRIFLTFPTKALMSEVVNKLPDSFLLDNSVPIKDVLNSYVDGTIDKFFDVVR